MKNDNIKLIFIGAVIGLLIGIMMYLNEIHLQLNDIVRMLQGIL